MKEQAALSYVWFPRKRGQRHLRQFAATTSMNLFSQNVPKSRMSRWCQCKGKQVRHFRHERGFTLQRLEDEMSARQNHRPQTVLSKDCHQNLSGNRDGILCSSWLCVPSIHSRFLRQRSQSRYTQHPRDAFVQHFKIISVISASRRSVRGMCATERDSATTVRAPPLHSVSYH